MVSSSLRILKETLFKARHRATYKGTFYFGRSRCFLNTKYMVFGNNFRIGEQCRLECYELYAGEKLTPSLTFGDNVYIGRNCTFYCADSIVIEDNVLIASYVFVSDENHGMEVADTPFGHNKLIHKPVRIKHNAWLCEKVCILPGVTIGHHSIIGAGSVVTKDVPDYSIAVGNPAKVIKKYDLNKKEWVKVK